MEEEQVFKWDIRNISMCPLITGEYLSSPIFYIGETRQVEMCLKLFPRGHSPKYVEYMTILLCRSNNYGPDSIKMKYKLSAFGEKFGKNAEYTQKFEKCRTRSFRIWQPKYFLALKRKDIFPLHYDDITVECKILLYTSDSMFAYYDLHDLENLSQCFARMLGNGEFSDMNIRTPSQNLKVHQFMLKSRCPALGGKSLKKLMEQHPKSCDEAIKTLLRYLYSGKFQYSDLPDDFHSFLKKLNSSIFEHLFTASCSETNAVTSFQIEKYAFEWKIENYRKTFKKKISFFIPKPNFRGLFKVKLYKRSREESSHFRIHRMCNKTNLSVHCDISCRTNDGEYFSMFADRHLFQNDERDWEIVICFETFDRHQRKVILQSDGTLNVKITIKICSGDQTTSVIKKAYTVNDEFSSNKKNLYGLAGYLKKLHADPSYSDFYLVVGREKIRAHKAVLSARSTRFNSILAHDTVENRETVSAIEGLNTKAVRSMLSYMYCGEVDIDDLEFAFHLYLAANRYEIQELEEKCKRYIILSLNPKNVGWSLIFAYEHTNQEFRHFLSDYVCHNEDLLSEFMYWYEELKSRPQLAFLIKLEVSIAG